MTVTIQNIINTILENDISNDKIDNLINAIRNPIESIVGMNCTRNIFGLISSCHYFQIKSIYGNYDIFYFLDENYSIRSTQLYFRILSETYNKMYPLFNNKRDIVIAALEDTYQIMIN